MAPNNHNKCAGLLTGVTGTFAGMSAENSSIRWDKRVRLIDAVRALFVDVDGQSRGFR
jgi:hypothetical protein